MNWKQLSEKFFFLPEEIEFEEVNQLDLHYEVELPDSYKSFIRYFGAGTLGNFFHFHPPAHMNTHGERLNPFLDNELKEMIDENDSGEILIFAETDNGDMLGWRLNEMNGNLEPKVYQIPARSFYVEEYSNDVKDLIVKLIQDPPDHLVDMKLTYLRRCS